MYQDIYEKSKVIVRDCGSAIKKMDIHNVEYKNGIHDLVSDVDIFASSYLTKRLEALTPEATFIDEEGEQMESASTWIIDPIDGTTNYITSHQEFAICVAYFHENQPVFGIVYDVMKDEMTCAYVGRGAYCNGIRLKPTEVKPLSACVWDASYKSILKLNQNGSKMDALMKHTRAHRSLGCTALAIVNIARGKLDAYLSTNVKCWDYAAANIVLSEVEGSSYVYGEFLSVEPVTALFTASEEIMEQMKTYILSEENL